MNLLAIESSALFGSIACFCNDELLCQRELHKEQRSARTLVPTIRETLEEVSWRPKQIDLIAITAGPGSFTGLRVGVTTAKSLAYATDAKTVGVNTLDVIAFQANRKGENSDPPVFPSASNPLHVAMDAQRKQFFAARYEAEVDGVPIMIDEPLIVEQEQWFAERTSDDSITGPGLHRRKEQKCAARVIPQSQWMPMAEAVGRVGLAKFAKQGSDDLWALVPNYYRKSAAEERRQS